MVVIHPWGRGKTNSVCNFFADFIFMKGMQLTINTVVAFFFFCMKGHLVSGIHYFCK